MDLKSVSVIYLPCIVILIVIFFRLPWMACGKYVLKLVDQFSSLDLMVTILFYLSPVYFKMYFSTLFEIQLFCR